MYKKIEMISKCGFDQIMSGIVIIMDQHNRLYIISEALRLRLRIHISTRIGKNFLDICIEGQSVQICIVCVWCVKCVLKAKAGQAGCNDWEIISTWDEKKPAGASCISISN